MASAPTVGLNVWIVVIAATLLAALLDLRTRRIPNWLTGSLFLGGSVWAIYGGGWAGLGDGFLACLLLAAPYVLLFLLTPAGGGAADAKLMGAVGMWLGFRHAVPVLVLVTLSGAVLGIAYAVASRKAGKLISNLYQMTFGLLSLASGLTKWNQAADVLPEQKRMLAMPYGLSIFAGVCAAAMMSLAHRGGGLP
jgi:prepilin peptidase CpaA